jgi:hypothetical protein
MRTGGRPPRSPPGESHNSVRDGVVQLHGAIIDERQRDAIKVAAENVPGVRKIHDHMIWIDPIGATVLQSQEDAARVREEIRRGI